MDHQTLDYKWLIGIVGSVALAVSTPLLAAVKWLFNAREREHAQILQASQQQVSECKQERDKLYAKIDSDSARHHQQMLEAYQQHHEQMLAATKQYAEAVKNMLDDNKRIVHQHTTTASQLTEWMAAQTHKVEVMAQEIADLRDEIALDRKKTSAG